MNQFQNQSVLLTQIVHMYDNAKLPLAVFDSNLTLLWHNNSMTFVLPCISVLKGVESAFFNHYGVLEIKTKIAHTGRFCSFHNPKHLFTSHELCLFAPPSACGEFYFLTPTADDNSKDFISTGKLSNSLSSFESHYRTPLSTIFSALTPLLRRADEDTLHPDFSKYLRSIGKSSMELLRSGQLITDYTRLISDIYDFQLRPVELTGLLSDFFLAAAELTDSLGISLSYNCPTHSVYALCDPILLTNALSHLISNACRFTRNGNRIEAVLRVRDSGISIIISDKGLGIPAEIAPRIFEPYFSYSHNGEPFSGNGLGLAIAFKSASLMGGTLTFTSIAGEGSAFRYDLIYSNENDELKLEYMESNTVEDYLDDPFSDLRLRMADVLPYNIYSGFTF